MLNPIKNHDIIIGNEIYNHDGWDSGGKKLTTRFPELLNVAESIDDLEVDYIPSNPLNGKLYAEIRPKNNTIPEDYYFHLEFANELGLIYSSANIIRRCDENSRINGIPIPLINYEKYNNLIMGGRGLRSIMGDSGGRGINFYALSLNRKYYKHGVDINTFKLKISRNTAIDQYPVIMTASNTKINTELGEAHYIKISDGSIKTSGGSIYGVIIPSIGLILLNAIPAITPNKAFTNSYEEQIKGFIFGEKSFAFNNNDRTRYLHSIEFESQEHIVYKQVFIRALNDQFNHTENPSYFNNKNEIKNPYFINNPTTYITSIGLYNNNEDLLAIAKLKKPIKKSTIDEALIRIKLIL